jgi:hypothetical protein
LYLYPYLLKQFLALFTEVAKIHAVMRGYVRTVFLFSIAAGILTIGAARSVMAQNPKPCSYTAVNDNCSVTINRMNPVTPPTIYVKRGGSVTVVVTDPSPLEDLTLDWKSSATAIPPDTFQTAFTAISGNIGKFTVIERIPPSGPFAQVITKCEIDINGCDSAPPITAAQERVMLALRSNDPLTLADAGLKSIKTALQPPPGGASSNVMPWHDTKTWKPNVVTQLNIPGGLAKQKELDANIKLLSSEIAVFKKAHTSAGDANEIAILDKNQASLNSVYDGFSSSLAKLAVLEAAVNGIPDTSDGIEGNAVIKDLTPSEKNYQTQTWVVDYTNKLTATAKRVAADTLKTESAALMSGLADASAKVPVVTITVQFQSLQRFEVSTGLMVPLTPYHSYVKASVAKNGVVTDNVVQESKTYTVVPIVFVNVLGKEWITRQQRSAWFLTGGVGYNPATSAVEFGAGMTFSYRSVAVSFLADVGRDTKLGGGFTVGQSLGLSNAASPITSTYWTVKPALAISVRIPLGGSSK